MEEKVFDTPIMLKIWTRPDCQRKQFEVIKRVKPRLLFVSSDGGRNEEEWKAIKINRNMFDSEIDWDCKVIKQYWNKNIGLYSAGGAMHKLVFQTVDRCIFLEDDILPSESFFYFCAEMLERYKDDTRIRVICGMNHLGVSEDVTSDYFFSRQGSIWGTATWKRAAEDTGCLDYKNDEYVMKNLVHLMKRDKDLLRRTKGYASDYFFDGHRPGNEFKIEFSAYGYNQLQIIPKKNLVSNIGCTAGSAHADELRMLPRLQRKYFNMPLYELEFPLKHPKYIFPDEEYEKKRNTVMLYNRPVLVFLCRVERVFLLLKYGKIKHIFNKLFEKIRNRRTLER